MSCGKWGVWGWKRLDKYNESLLIKVSKTYRHFSNPIFTEFKTCWKLFLERSELNGFQIQWLEGWDALMGGQFIRKVNNVPRRQTSFLGFMLPLRFRSLCLCVWVRGRHGRVDVRCANGAKQRQLRRRDRKIVISQSVSQSARRWKFGSAKVSYSRGHNRTIREDFPPSTSHNKNYCLEVMI